jgi:hypothetical protein
MLAAEVEAVRETVYLDSHLLLEGHLEHALEIERVLRPCVDVAAGGMTQATHVWIAQRLEHARGHLPSRHPLPAVHARLHPFQLRQDAIGKIEPTVGEDVALDPTQHAERRERLVGGGDLLALTPHVVRGEPGHRSHRRRVIADRQVVVATIASRPAHLLDALPTV